MRSRVESQLPPRELRVIQQSARSEERVCAVRLSARTDVIGRYLTLRSRDCESQREHSPL